MTGSGFEPIKRTNKLFDWMERTLFDRVYRSLKRNLNGYGFLKHCVLRENWGWLLRPALGRLATSPVLMASDR